MGTIADKISVLNKTKSDLKDAIIAKGGEVLDTDPFSMYAERLNKAKSGGDKVLAQTTEASVTGAEGEKVFLNPMASLTNRKGYPCVDYMVSTTNTVSPYSPWGARMLFHLYAGPYVLFGGETPASGSERVQLYKYSDGFFEYKDLVSSFLYYPRPSAHGLTATPYGVLYHNEVTDEIVVNYDVKVGVHLTTTGVGGYHKCFWQGDYFAVLGSTKTDTDGNSYNVEVWKYSEDTTTGIKALELKHRIYLPNISTCFFSQTDPIVISRGSNYIYAYKLDLENGTFTTYTGDYTVLGTLGWYYAGNILLAGGQTHKIRLDDETMTIVVEESSAGKIPSDATYLTRGYNCITTFVSTNNNTIYQIENFDDYDTFRILSSYTPSYTRGVIIDDKYFVGGNLVYDKGSIVKPIEEIEIPFTFGSDSNYQGTLTALTEGGIAYTYYNNYPRRVITGPGSVLNPVVNSVGANTGSQANPALRHYFKNGTSYFMGDYKIAEGRFVTDTSTNYAELLLSPSTSILKRVSGTFWDDLAIVGGGWKNYDTIYAVIPNDDGTFKAIPLTVSFAEDSPLQSFYTYANYIWAFFREGNKIYISVSGSYLYEATLDIENNSFVVTHGRNFDTTNSSKISPITKTKDDRYYLSADGVVALDTGDTAKIITTPYPSRVLTELEGESIWFVQTFYDNHIVFHCNKKAVLCKYTNSIDDLEVVATYTFGDAESNFSFSQNRKYMTASRRSSYLSQIYELDPDNPYTYVAYKPAPYRSSVNTLTGFCTGNQGTDENGRRYVEVATVLPEEESS